MVKRVLAILMSFIPTILVGILGLITNSLNVKLLIMLLIWGMVSLIIMFALILKKDIEDFETMDRVLDWDFKNEYMKEIDGSIKKSQIIGIKIFNNLKKYFTDFNYEFQNVQLISQQLDGVVDGMVDASNNVKLAAEFIAEGAVHQAEDADQCMKVTEVLANKINIMDGKSKELIELAYEMGNVNISGKEAIETFLLTNKKTKKLLNLLQKKYIPC